MKVYVFTHHCAACCEFLGVENKVFKNKEDALKKFREWREEELEYVNRNGWVIGTDDIDGHFEAYEDGDYCCSHTEGFVNEYEI